MDSASSSNTTTVELDEEADNLFLAGGANGRGDVIIVRSDGVTCAGPRALNVKHNVIRIFDTLFVVKKNPSI